MKATIINVPEIEKVIRSKHKKFLKDVGPFASKISSDHQLCLTRLFSKITRVIECFVKEGVIDSFARCSLPYVDGEYVRSFCIKKKEFADSVYLWTDGKIVILGDSKFPFTEVGCESIRNIDLENFDGVAFSKTLLDFIHRKIYSRQESYEQRIFGDCVTDLPIGK